MNRTVCTLFSFADKRRRRARRPTSGVDQLADAGAAPRVALARRPAGAVAGESRVRRPPLVALPEHVHTAARPADARRADADASGHGSSNSALHSGGDANAPPALEPAAPMSSTIRSIAQQSSRLGPGPGPNAASSAAPPQLNLSAARMYGTLRGPLSSSPLPDVALVNHKTPTSPRGAASHNSESQFPLEAPAPATTGQLDVPQTPLGRTVPALARCRARL